MTKTSKTATHKLNNTDVSLLNYIQRHQQAIFSGVLSNIAMRLNYKVTENTQFQLSADLTELTITELAPEPNSSDEAIRRA